MKKLLLATIILSATQSLFAQKTTTLKDLTNKPADYRTMKQGATVNGQTAFTQLWLSTSRFEQSVKKAEEEMKAKGFKKVDKATAVFDNYGALAIKYEAEAKMAYVVKIFYSSFDGEMNVYWKHPDTPGIGTKNTTQGYSENERSLTVDEYSPASNATVNLHIETDATAAQERGKQFTVLQILVFKKKK